MLVGTQKSRGHQSALTMVRESEASMYRRAATVLSAAMVSTLLFAQPADAQQRSRGDVDGASCANPIDAGAFPGPAFIDTRSTCGAGDNYSETEMDEFDGGEDLIYTFTLTEDTCITISLTGDETADPDAEWSGMALYEETCDPESEIALVVAATSLNPEFIDIDLAAGTYFLLVDSWPPPNCFDFQLIIQPCTTGACCQPDGTCSIETVPDCTALDGIYAGDDVPCEGLTCFPAEGDNCADPFVLNIPADLNFATIDSTEGRGNSFSGSCMGDWDGSFETVYQLNVTEDTCLAAVMTASNNLAGMAILDDCGDPAGATCIQTATTSANPDILLLNLDAGTYYLIVDAFLGEPEFIYILDLIPCPVGPCCLPDGSCIETDLLDCDNQGGIFQTDALSCAEAPCGVDNDICENATNLNAIPRGEGDGDNVWSVTASNEGAVGDISTGCATFGGEDANDVWIEWTAPCDGVARFDLCESNFDTVMTIYDSCDTPLDDFLECNDDSTGICGGSLQSEIEGEVFAGTTYYVRIAGWDNAEGTYTLNVTLDIPGDANADLNVGLADLLAVLSNWGTAGPTGDVDDDGAVDLSDLLAVLSNWGSNCL